MPDTRSLPANALAAIANASENEILMPGSSLPNPQVATMHGLWYLFAIWPVAADRSNPSGAEKSISPVFMLAGIEHEP